jgi:hypothetical protein
LTRVRDRGKGTKCGSDQGFGWESVQRERSLTRWLSKASRFFEHEHEDEDDLDVS